MDILQHSPVGPWPDLEEDGQVGWLPTRDGPAPAAEAVTSSPPAWPATTSLTLVREVQKLVSAQTDSRPEAWPAPRTERRPVGTYSPFRRDR